MTQARDPNDRTPGLDRELLSLNRRITRLEDSQITGRELKESFGRVYDGLEDLMNQRLDLIEQRFDRLDGEIAGMRSELNGKFDTIMGYLTGMQNS